MQVGTFWQYVLFDICRSGLNDQVVLDKYCGVVFHVFVVLQLLWQVMWWDVIEVCFMWQSDFKSVTNHTVTDWEKTNYKSPRRWTGDAFGFRRAFVAFWIQGLSVFQGDYTDSTCRKSKPLMPLSTQLEKWTWSTSCELYMYICSLDLLIWPRAKWHILLMKFSLCWCSRIYVTLPKKYVSGM